MGNCFGKRIKIRFKKVQSVESGDKGDVSKDKDGNKGTPQPVRRSGAQATKSLASLMETTTEKVRAKRTPRAQRQLSRVRRTGFSGLIDFQEPATGTSEVTDDFAPELFVTRPTVGNRQTKIVQKLNMRESVQKVIEEKRSESILRGNSSSISIKRASSRQSKLSFGGDEIRTYEKVCIFSWYQCSTRCSGH